jgi:electron transport complex protein RnfE
MIKSKQVLFSGLTNNPVFVLIVGLCPVLAVSTTLANSFWLGLSTLFVLVMSNLVISSLRNVIPDKVRIPCYIMISATICTVVDMFLLRFLPSVHSSIGSFIKLIVVNCLILARAETFAKNSKPHIAMLDGFSMGMGFLVAIVLVGFFRELLGLGTIFGFRIITLSAQEGVFVAGIAEAVGGFFILAFLMAIFNKVYGHYTERQKLKPVEEAVAEAGVGVGVGAEAEAGAEVETGAEAEKN